MKTIKQAQAGSFESSDVLILASPVKTGSGRQIHLESSVIKQYEDQINKLINDILDKYEIQDIQLKINDKGAIIPVFLARMETVLERALSNQQGTMY